MRRIVPFLAVLALAFAVSSARGTDEDLPILVPAGRQVDRGIRNALPVKDLNSCIGGPAKNGAGLTLDLGDETLSGQAHTGPYPFEEGEADYDYARYRASSRIEKGEGILVIAPFFRDKYNANDWPAGRTDTPPTLTVAYRLDLWRASDGGAEHLGFFDGRVSFRREGATLRKIVTVEEGPLATMLTSDHPGRATIAFRTDVPATGEVWLAPDDGKADLKTAGESAAGRRHEIEVSGLEAGRGYRYRVIVRSGDDEAHSSVYTFRAAPKAGDGDVTFAFGSDSREGVGGGEREVMGVNHHVLSRVVVDAYRRGADLAIFGGDLVNGYTTDVDDFRLQLRSWKRGWEGFWRGRPVYPAMGNHETLLRVVDPKPGPRVAFDRWPYGTDSAEAVFADEFVNPENGPDPSDPRRPPYRENVYSFTYGPVLFVAFNNNYWWTSNRDVPKYGGSPEGCILDDQLSWIERTLAAAAKNADVRFVVLYAQEPIFPCGGHLGDAMWWNGDNRVRAHERRGEKVVPVGPGIVEVRNRFWRAVSGCPKAAVVLTGDEHAYARLLVDAETPVGVPEKDDTDGNGVLDRFSPNPAFTHPTWHVVAGNAGAPHYSRQKTPWEPTVFSSQPGYCLFRTDGPRISMTAYTITGQAMDRVDDLLAIKRRKR